MKQDEYHCRYPKIPPIVKTKNDDFVLFLFLLTGAEQPDPLKIVMKYGSVAFFGRNRTHCTPLTDVKLSIARICCTIKAESFAAKRKASIDFTVTDFSESLLTNISSKFIRYSGICPT